MTATAAAVAFVCLFLAAYLLLGGFALFEDGSFRLGPLSGCLPVGPCNEGWPL